MKKFDFKIFLSFLWGIGLFSFLYFNKEVDATEALDISMMSYGLFFGIGFLFFTYKFSFFAMNSGLKFIFWKKNVHDEVIKEVGERFVHDITIIIDYLYYFSFLGFWGLFTGNLTTGNNPINALGYGIIALIFYWLKKSVFK